MRVRTLQQDLHMRQRLRAALIHQQAISRAHATLNMPQLDLCPLHEALKSINRRAKVVWACRLHTLC